MKKKNVLKIVVLLLFVLILGCKKDEMKEDVGLCPTVIFTDPANGATNVPLDQVVSVKFNEKMNSASINSSAFVLQRPGKGISADIAGTLTYNAINSTMYFTPNAKLLANTTYTGRVKTTVKDLRGNALQTDYVWSFSTGSVILPMVISTDPVNNAVNVVLNKVVTATFSMPMDATTLNASTFTLKQGATTVTGTVDYTDTTASFTPSVNLLGGTVYTATITTGAKNVAGVSIATNYVWTFTTGVIVAPMVISTDPTNKAVGVLTNKIITATFSVPMDPLTITGTSFTIKQGITTVAGTVTYAGSIATFTPTVNLLAGTVYTGTITTAAKNVAGTPIANNYVWTFTTLGASAPTVISTDPTNNEIGVVVNKKITATFSVPMNATTITGATFTVKQGLTPVAGTVTYAGSTATFTPSGNLTVGTVYTATITTGAKNVAGTALASNYVWSFTTLIVTAPTVTSTDPINNAVGVTLNKKVTATFSVPMDPLTLTGTTFTVKQGVTPVAGTVTYAGTTATFTPSVNLLAGTVYTATITTGAKNVAGTPIASNYVWSFTTAVAIVPTVTSTDPTNNAIGVVLNKKVTAIFSIAMDPLTITGLTFTLKQGVTPVAGTVTYVGTTATFTPTVDLLPKVLYTATITTGAESVAGTPIASNYVWSFTTLQPPPNLGSASKFGAFGGNAGVTNQGINTVINNGGIGTTAASTLITGFHDGLTGDIYTETPLNVGNVKGGIFTAPPAPGTATSAAIAALALLDAQTAYNSISPASKPGGIDPGAGELGGLTLAPGIYKSASGTFKITNGNLTLDAQGDPNAVWIFQTAAGLTVGIAGPAGARSVLMINGGLPNNVFWYVGSAATINGAGGGIMTGTIISTAGVTFSTAGNVVQTVLNGRAISLVASVTMVNTTINIP